jgi:hypothetical protein
MTLALLNLPLVVDGILLNFIGHLQPKPGVWYNLKLSASPTLERDKNEHDRDVVQHCLSPSHKSLYPPFLLE